ncbi:cholesterol 7-desaturase nvd-like [Crassostrea angulata]|uniref:cholesterol 7-desaturase nvd-like n=1 Tax=Magallana angulata TaxID=2784310 RepID=UPI0022B136D7|nr:cholesterol 7-desaturase nvd-like [Crassostrea angulata]
MTMGHMKKFGSFGATLCLLILAVSATVTQRLLNVPLYETAGRLWTCKWNFPLLYLLTDYRVIITCTVITVLFYPLYKLYGVLFLPMDRVRNLGDIGYIPEGRMSMKEMANRVRRQRATGDLPPIYPNGWFGLIEGSKIKAGDVKNISLLGLNLAVFRGEDGTIHVIDAYCPHMGANLAVGGRVVGDCLECPFHGWQFRGSDGQCTKIPYSEKVPDIAKVKSYISDEANGYIYFWYHAEDSAPTWTVPRIEEIQSGDWVYRGRTEHYINCHIEEVPENGADLQHLECVHAPLITSGIDLRNMWSALWSFGSHSWTANWETNPPPNEHIGTLRLTHSMNLFGKAFRPVDMDVTAQQIGPGIVYLTFHSPIGSGTFVQHLVPTEPLVQKLVHNLYFQKNLPAFIGKFFLLGEAIQLERDIMIWNNKRYEKKPLFVKSKEDSQVAKHRRWFSQFYSENSPRLKFQRDTLEW